jgi:hypothetical protein
MPTVATDIGLSSAPPQVVVLALTYENGGIDFR